MLKSTINQSWTLEQMTADDAVTEEREELMIPPSGGGQVRLRTGHFLRPSVTSIHGLVAAPSLDSFSYSAAAHLAEYKDFPLKVHHRGWKYQLQNWSKWVDRMHCLHHSTWKRAGILEAIMSSRCIIHRCDDLILGLVEKWCPTTNSFVFPWGEATISLEDMMVLGGYPVLGESVFVPTGGGEMEEIVKELQRARSSIYRSKSKKAAQNKWITLFMGSQSETEHEAFLAYWLSRFVFPFSRDTIGRSILSIAVHLARGTKIALAPAVLAGIYKSLTLLKAAVIAVRKCRTEESQSGVLDITVTAPLVLVQVWIWERFPAPRPEPKSIGQNEPRLARWHNLRLGSGYQSLTIDSAGKDFQWRPYTMIDSNVVPGMIYMDNERWAMVDSDLDEDLKGFVRCLRTSELVSLEANCIEHYLPHRVARQFGMDQDLPGHVARVNVNPDIAWRDYTRPIRDAKLYVPSRLSKPCVTARYLKWWKKLNLSRGGIAYRGADGKSACEDWKRQVQKDSLEDDFLPPPPGFSPKRKRVEEAGVSGQFQVGKDTDFMPQQVVQRQSPLYSAANNGETAGLDGKDGPRSLKRKLVGSSSRERSDCNDTVYPPGFAPKPSQVEASHAGTGIDKEIAQLSGSGTRGSNWSRDNAQGKYQLSSTIEDGNIEEARLLVEPVESQVQWAALTKEAWKDRVDKKYSTSPSQVQSGTSGPPGGRLEERITPIEKLLALIKAGKISLHSMKIPNDP